MEVKASPPSLYKNSRARAYIENVAQFAKHFGRSAADLGAEEIRTPQVYMTNERHLAPSSLEIAVCALRFFYKVTAREPWSFGDPGAEEAAAAPHRAHPRKSRPRTGLRRLGRHPPQIRLKTGSADRSGT